MAAIVVILDIPWAWNMQKAQLLNVVNMYMKFEVSLTPTLKVTEVVKSFVVFKMAAMVVILDIPWAQNMQKAQLLNVVNMYMKFEVSLTHTLEVSEVAKCLASFKMAAMVAILDVPWAWNMQKAQLHNVVNMYMKFEVSLTHTLEVTEVAQNLGILSGL